MGKKMKPHRLPSPLPVGIAVAAHQLLLPSFRPSPPLICMFLPLLLLLASSPAPCLALKCLDCVGRDCMGSTCEGDYCLISHYAPRWGTMVWGEPDMVKGCLSGGMLRGDVRSHCEIGDGQEEEEEQPFTCLCNGQDFCNRDWAVRRLEVEPVPLYTCVCQGPHCQGRSTCTGQLCTFVQNHRSRASEQGCANASVPLLERRTSGACMIPPITGAMHHNTVARTALDLLHTESCVCEGDYCNSRKPKLTVPENSRGPAFVYVEVMGQRVSSRNFSCGGEFCFRAEIRSQLGQMSKYRVMGCASFANDAQLAEELDPTGCANFNSEKLQVEVCFQTEDRAAIARARDRRQRGGGGVRKPSSRTRDWPRSSEQERDEGGEIDEWPEEEFDKQ